MKFILIDVVRGHVYSPEYVRIDNLESISANQESIFDLKMKDGSVVKIYHYGTAQELIEKINSEISE